MKKAGYALATLFITALFALLIIGCTGDLGTSVTTDDTEVTVKSIGTVSGLAKDKDTGDFVFGAFITLGGKFAMSFATGQYMIEDIEVGNSLLIASAEGYKLYQEVYEVSQGAQIHDIILEPIDETPPTVQSVSPTDGSTGVPTNAQITATFDDDIDDTTLTNTSFTVVGASSGSLGGTIVYDADLKKVEFDHTGNDLGASELYTVTITTDVTDTDANALEADYVWTFTTGTGTDLTKPNDPTGLTATSGGTDRIDLSWTASTSTDVAGYDVGRDDNGDSNIDLSEIIASVASTAYTNTGLSPNTQYTYYVRAYDVAGNQSAWVGPASATTADVDTTAPAEVTNFSASAGDAVVTLTWTNPTDPDFEGVWLMRRSDGIYPTGPEDPKAVGLYKGTGTKYTDSKVSNGTTYLYKIFTFDREPNFSSGVAAKATPQAVDTTPPAEVIRPQAIPGDQQITLVWTDPKDLDLKGVLIWRDGSKKAEVKAGIMKWPDPDTLNNGQPYKYLLQTFDGNGNYSKGVTVTGTPQSAGILVYPTNLGDTYIFEADPATNYNRDGYLLSGLRKGWMYAVMRFDMTGLASAKVAKAILTLEVAGHSDDVAETYYVYRIAATEKPWPETGATWENLIKYVDLSKSYAKFSLISSTTSVVIDVTELVYVWQEEFAKYKATNGLAIVPGSKTEHYYYFSSKERGTTPPELEVTTQ